MADSFGVKIGVEGEKAFKQALYDINQSFKVLGSEMKLVASEFDKNDTSMEALTARNQVLNKEIDAQKEKIETLRAALDNASASFGENDRRTQNWQIQLNNAEAALNKMVREVEENGKAMDSLGDSSDEAGDAMDGLEKDTKDAGNAMDDASKKSHTLADALKNGLVAAAEAAAVAVGAAVTAVVGFAKSSVEVGMNFDSSMSQVAATMGKTVDEIGDLRDFALEMGSTTAFSATEAADALNYMALAGYDADEAMAALPNVLNLAAAGNMDLARASDMVTDAQSALGLSMDESTELVNKMAMASSKSNTSVAQLGDAILTVGGTAKNLAGGTTELSTALGVLADNGVKGAEGGTALRNIILSLSAPTDKAAAAMQELGLEVFDAEGNMRPLNEVFGDLNTTLGAMSQEERIGVLNTIFNKVDLKSVNALLSSTVEGVGDVGAALENSGINWEKYSDKAWAADGAVNGMMADLVYNMAELGTSADELQEYLEWEYGLDTEDAIAAIAAVDSALNENGTRWDELSGYIDDAKDSAEEMAGTQLDNLAGSITLFKSALEGAQIAISDELTPTLRDFTQFGAESLSTMTKAFKENGLEGLMDELGTVLSDALNMIIDYIPQIIEAGMQLLGALGQGLMDNLPVIMEAVTEIIMTLVEGLVEALPQLLEAGLQIIVMLAQGISESLPELVPAIVEVVAQMVQVLVDNLPLLLDAALQLILGLAQGIIDAIPVLIDALPAIITGIVEFLVGAIPQIVDAGIQLLTSLVAALPDIIMAIVEALPEIISGIVGGLMEAIPQIIAAGIQLFVSLVGNLPAIIAGIVAALPEIIFAILEGLGPLGEMLADLFSGAWEGIKDVFAGAGEFFSGVWDDICGVFDGIGDWFGDRFRDASNAAQSAWDGVSGFFSDVWDGITWAFDGAADWFGDRFNDASNAVQWAWDGVGGFFSDIWGEISGAFGDAASWFSDIFSDAWSNITGVWDSASDFFGGIWDSITGAFSGAWDAFCDIGGMIVEGLWDGISSMGDWLWDQVTGWAGDIVDWAKSALGIASPSKEFANIGGFMAQGIEQGFSREMRSVEDTVRRATEDLIPDVDFPTLSLVRNAGGANVQVVQNIYASDTSYAGQQREAAKQMRLVAREVMA